MQKKYRILNQFLTTQLNLINCHSKWIFLIVYFISSLQI
jgi:hypothetical protein